MRIFLLLSVMVLSVGCSSGDTKPDPTPGTGGGSCAGEFHQGPYTDPESGKTCNGPGGYCASDKACHSSASKCKKPC